MMYSYSDVAVSFVLLCISVIFCQMLRVISRTILPVKYQQYSAEVVSTFQLVVGFMEGDIILELLGPSGYAIFLFFLIISFILTFDGAADPGNTFYEFLIGNVDSRTAVCKVVCQVIGGQFAFPWVRMLWRAEMSNPHAAQVPLMDSVCPSCLHVSLMSGAIAEMVATFTYSFVMALEVVGGKMERYVDAGIQVFIIMIGYTWTGMMFNPALASALTFNCHNHPFYEHVTVYWLGPLTGVLFHYLLKHHSKEHKQKDTTVTSRSQGKLEMSYSIIGLSSKSNYNYTLNTDKKDE
ncbi:aquaporin-12A-like [Anneissia japonica]|uniref:aquaporin-12A-like n=1 Tax=Anneissia japonica TaxID=1529436 RepID=UPI001425B968|nr:aquaporin-12A-like [Anneissia japonica]